jgi:uncharacterized paraquat-inducible protein A
VQAEARRRSLQEVRCLACNVVYDLPLDVSAPEHAGCPECGALVWLAASIPPAESELTQEQ